jgi:undecaprenyl-diphosphatase
VIVLVVVASLSVVAGASAAALVHAAPRADPALSATKAIGEEIGRHRSIRRFLDSRIERGVATGLALTLSLLAMVAAGILIGVLIYMVRSQTGLVQVDRAVERWSDPRMTSLSIATLGMVTAFGGTATVIALGLVTAGYAVWRWRSRAIPLFLAIAIGGQLILADVIKGAVQRTRPDLRPLAHFSGPSFPSGHTTAAAATFAAIAIVLGRDGSSTRRMLLAGVAVALAVAVGCSRVFLGVHWVTDALGGLILGWTWVALVAVAFGGRVMRFAAPVKAAVAPEPSRFGGKVQGTGVGPPQREEIQ